MHAIQDNIAAAAIVHPGKGYADASLLQFVRQAQEKGYAVCGLVPGLQHEPSKAVTRCVVDLTDGTRYPITQNLGKQSDACCLDPGALLEAAVVLRRALQSNADLVIVNRFGVLEAEGGGFAADMLELMARGYPVLTVVSEPNLDAWRTFTGRMASELPPDPQAIMAWFDQVQLSVVAVASGKPE